MYTETNKLLNSLTESSKLHSSSTHVKADPAVPTRRGVMFARRDLRSRFPVSRNWTTRGVSWRTRHLHASLNIPRTNRCSNKRPHVRLYNVDIVDIYGCNSERRLYNWTHPSIPCIHLHRIHAYSKLSARALIKFIGFVKPCSAHMGVGYTVRCKSQCLRSLCPDNVYCTALVGPYSALFANKSRIGIKLADRSV